MESYENTGFEVSSCPNMCLKKSLDLSVFFILLSNHDKHTYDKENQIS
jgi:hypothetical protein